MFPSHLQHTLLPEGYVVGPNDVVIGRGKRFAYNPGNQRFNAIIRSMYQAYFNAESKAKKSEIIGDVLAMVRADSGAGFIKQHCGRGRYLQVEEAASRIAIAQAFRDALSWSYKSSKKNKQVRRLERKRISETEQSLASAARLIQVFVSEESLQEPVTGFMFEEHHGLPFPSLLRTQSDADGSIATVDMRNILQDDSGTEPAAASMQYQPFNLGPPPGMKSYFWNPGHSESQTSFFSPRPATRHPTLNPASGDLFVSLCAILGDVAASSGDPFEPTPLPTSTVCLPFGFYSNLAPRAT
jgi:hypothetical protein